jgi:homoaconitase/3-isopropylmalate dehydratase large subunit
MASPQGERLFKWCGQTQTRVCLEKVYDVSELEPQIACPHQVTASRFRLGESPAGLLGSCVNGRLEDIAIAAGLIKGKRFILMCFWSSGIHEYLPPA